MSWLPGRILGSSAIGIERSKKLSRGHADNREGDVVDVDGLADDVRIALKPALPVSMSDHNNGLGACAVVTDCDRSTEAAIHTQPFVIVTADKLSACDFGLAVYIDIELLNWSKREYL